MNSVEDSSPQTSHQWQFWIDVGGTFTDCLARDPAGRPQRRKVLSSGVTKGVVAGVENVDSSFVLVDPARSAEPAGFWNGYQLRFAGEGNDSTTQIVEHQAGGKLRLDRKISSDVVGAAYEILSPQDSPLLAIRLILGLPLSRPIPPCSVRLGTTRGTNALLTRNGARTAFITTKGFADILRIGYQNRPDLFALDIRKPAPLFEVSVEIEERCASDGTVLVPLHEDAARQTLKALRAQGVESLAICLLHATVNPQHELRLAEIAAELGFQEVRLSSQIADLRKLVPRGDTTVVDAYLSPVLREYVGRLESQLPGSSLRLLTSAGGLVAAQNFSGKDSILSGPAGGVVGMSRAALAIGSERAIGFDMGGTSTDVARFDGRFEFEYETQKAGVRIVAPTLAIETVAAGGGSICRFDGTRLLVGPSSAGAEPGPACYGRGGPLTVTDLNLYLGRLDERQFPFPLDRVAVTQRLQELAAELATGTGQVWTIDNLAAGLVDIANTTMARAIRSISVAKGYDPRDYLLVAFGGAAAQHACALAEDLQMERVLLHPEASLLSAYGAGLADVTRHKSQAVHQPWSPSLWQDLQETRGQLARTAIAELVAEGIPAAKIELRWSLELRYRGVDAALVVMLPADEDFQAAFTAEHRRQYGYVHETRPLEVVSLRLEAIGQSAEHAEASHQVAAIKIAANATRRVFLNGQWLDVAVYQRAELTTGAQVEGPALIQESHTCTFLPEDWSAQLWSAGELVLSRSNTRSAVPASADQAEVILADPIRLQIFHHLFTGIAEQMGHTLRNTASSVNVKERLDFSCALFSDAGDLIVNAPHIPVHLGAMSETVRQVQRDNPQMQAGDVFVTNDPFRGGSHLPDVTVVTPVFLLPTEDKPAFFVASRAHHAEIGGITPGSMPPFSKSLAEEGVVLQNLCVVRRGVPQFAELEKQLRGGKYPSRAVPDNLADISAQIAANQHGVEGLLALTAKYGRPTVQSYMRHLQAAAEQKIRQALGQFPAGEYRFVDHLDDGTPIAVKITLPGTANESSAENFAATIDFTGTGGVLPNNLNANRAITTSAVLYVLRLLIGEEVPLNQGILAAIELILPECLLNPPANDDPALCPAVVGGNVETSQRVVDVLLGAFGQAAASQGTMNNLLFGDGTFGYYETICGGSGATAHQAGADAVHTHMTNTRLTDPEVLEQRFPVRLEEFSIRHGSGGKGLNRGGAGVIRRIMFLRPLTVSLLTQRRGKFPPYGQQGGEPGSIGINRIVRADGTREDLAGCVQIEVQTGDAIELQTPGGGGWGAIRDTTVRE